MDDLEDLRFRQGLRTGGPLFQNDCLVFYELVSADLRMIEMVVLDDECFRRMHEENCPSLQEALMAFPTHEEWVLWETVPDPVSGTTTMVYVDPTREFHALV